MKSLIAIPLLTGCVLSFEDRECYVSAECARGAFCREGACVSFDQLVEGELVVDPGDTELGTVAHRMTGAAAANDTMIAVDSTSGLAPGDEVLVIDLGSGTPSDEAGLGDWETARITGVDENTISLAQPGLTRSYGGDVHRVFVQRIPTYASLTIPRGATLTAPPYDGAQASGVLFLRVVGAASIAGEIDMDGRGHRGGREEGETGEAGDFDRRSDHHDGDTPSQWEDQDGNVLAADEEHHTHTAAGAAGVYHGGGCAGGGGGGHGTSGENGFQLGANDLASSSEIGAGGEPRGTPELAVLLLGAGGGSAARPPWAGDPITIAGGDGGGAILLFADRIAVSGRIRAEGAGGLTSPSVSCGTIGSGGGAGGSIYLSARRMMLGDFTVSALGGAGGASEIARGGNGGDGRVRFDVRELEGDANRASDPDPAMFTLP